MLDIELTLEVDDPNDEDFGDSTGLTASAYNRLIGAISEAGFSLVDGPNPA